jgi:hypothetical protein
VIDIAVVAGIRGATCMIIAAGWLEANPKRQPTVSASGC